MCVVLAGFANDLAIQFMLNATLDQNRHGFGTLIADHLANQGALEGCFSLRHLSLLIRRIDQLLAFRPEWSWREQYHGAQCAM